VAIWIIGEYSVTQAEVDEAFAAIRRNVGTLPIFEVKEEEEKQQAANDVGA